MPLQYTPLNQAHSITTAIQPNSPPPIPIQQKFNIIISSIQADSNKPHNNANIRFKPHNDIKHSNRCNTTKLETDWNLTKSSLTPFSLNPLKHSQTLAENLTNPFVEYLKHLQTDARRDAQKFGQNRWSNRQKSQNEARWFCQESPTENHPGSSGKLVFNLLPCVFYPQFMLKRRKGSKHGCLN